jgi:excisionase family DNA binding protein
MSKPPPTSPSSPVRKRGFDAQETATIVGLSLSTVNRGVRDGSIPSTKYGNRRIISEETIESLLAPK